MAAVAPGGELRGKDRDPWAGLVWGALLLAVVTAVDGLSGDGYALGFFYGLAPFTTAALGGTRSTPAMGLAATVLAALSGPWADGLTEGERALHIGVVGVASLIAVPTALGRARELENAKRFRILSDIAGVAGGGTRISEALDAVGEIVVPSFADFCAVDVFSDRGVERVGVKVEGPDAAYLERRIRERVPTVPEQIRDSPEGVPAEPVLVADVTPEHLDELAHHPADRRLLEDLGMRSYIKVPMFARGRQLGALSLAVCWSGRRYGPGDLDFVRVLSGRIALALDNAGLFSDLRELELRTETVMSSLDEGVLIHDANGRLVFANDAAASAFDHESAAELIANIRQVGDRISFYDQSGLPSRFADTAVARALGGEELEPEIMRVSYAGPRSELWLRVKVRAVDLEGADPVVVSVLEDVTEIKREELAQTMLSRMGGLLSFSNDFGDVLHSLAGVPVPELADSCEISMARTYRSVNFFASAHRDPGRRGPIGVPPEGSSTITADLEVGETKIGTLRLVNDPGHRAFDEFDRALAHRLAERAAVVLENVRLAGARAEIADSLQHGLLPTPLPHIPEWTVAALYRPAGEENQVGGDFYEAFAIEGGWMVAIGDVTGKGAHAASVTAQVRYTLRTAGALSADPVATLQTLNRSLLARGDGAMCSVAIIVLKDGDHRVQTAVAGHPLPLLVADGGLEAIGTTGPVLGAFPSGRWSLDLTPVGHGGRIFLYTDGVVETPGEHERFGEKRLRDCLAEARCSVSSIDRVERMVHEFADGHLEDDVAIVALTREPEWDDQGVTVLTESERQKLRAA